MSDLRYPGGNSASIAAEVRAQQRPGTPQSSSTFLSTRQPACQNRKIAHCVGTGLADLLPPHHRVGPARCSSGNRACWPRRPRWSRGCRRTSRCSWSTRPDRRASAGGPSLLRLRRRPRPGRGALRRRAVGADRPSVRDALARTAPPPHRATDWHNIIDVDEWRTTGPAGSRPPGDRPPQPRRSREVARDRASSSRPTPTTARVRVGSSAAPTRGPSPRPPAAQLEVHEFGSMSPRDFLRRIDFFVYYHHPGWSRRSAATSSRRWPAAPRDPAPPLRATFGDGRTTRSRQACARSSSACTTTRRPTGSDRPPHASTSSTTSPPRHTSGACAS